MIYDRNFNLFAFLSYNNYILIASAITQFEKISMEFICENLIDEG